MEPGIMKQYGYWLSFFKIVIDLFVTIVSFWIAYMLRFHWLENVFPLRYGLPPFQHYLILFAMVVIGWPIVFTFLNEYRIHRKFDPAEEFYHTLLNVGFASAVVWSMALYYRVFHQRGLPSREWFEPSRLMFLMFIGLDVLAVYGGRRFVYVLMNWFRRRGFFVRRYVFVGSGELARKLYDGLLKLPGIAIDIVGYVSDENSTRLPELPRLGKIKDLPRILEQYRVNGLFIALPLREHQKIDAYLDKLIHFPLDVKFAFDTITHNYLHTSIDIIGDIPLIGLNETAMDGPGYVVKRVLDIVFSSIALIASAPVMALIALWIRIVSPEAPIIFRQIRMGLDGKPFVMYKFRTMIPDAEPQGPRMATPDDERLLPGGRFLRMFSLDELPQFWNVLVGDMSLVGPRPERPHFVLQFIQKYPQFMIRHRGKGGITGLSQIAGLRGGQDNIEERMKKDIEYLTHWSIWLDLKILLLTPLAMIKYRGI